MTTRNTAPVCFPDRFALALLGLALALYLGLGWLVLASNRNAIAFRDVVLVAEEALGRIRETVEGMRALTVLRLGTGEARYAMALQERSRQLVDALTILRRLAPEADGLYDLPEIQAHLDRIAGLEAQALTLADGPDAGRAWAMVSGPEYEAAAAELRACLDHCHGAINAGLERLLAGQTRHAQAGLIAIAVATPVLAILFLLLLRRAVRATRENAAAQAALAESERRFRATFEQAAVGIAHVGLDGSFLRVNARFAAITGYSVHELSNLTFAAITYPDDLDEDLRQVTRLRAGDCSTYTMDKRYARKDGQPVWASLTVSLLRDDAGAPLYYIAVIADISERKAAEAAARENAAAVTTLLDAASDRVIVADATGRILAVNAAAAAGLGLTPQTLVCLDFETVFPEELARSRLIRLRRALSTGRPVRFTDERDGIIFDHIIAPLPQAAGQPGRAALFARDATQFVRAREAAEAASRAKSNFLANVSHELRTPLNGILGMAQVLGASPLDAEQRQCLDDIDSAAGALLTLVNDLLELSSLEAEDVELSRQPIVLSSLLEGATASLTPLAAAKGLTLDTRLGPDAPRLVMGDGDRLREVLATLVGNAVKFTETGGVTIEVDSVRTCAQAARTEQAGTMVEVTFAVRDTGIGIARQDQARIFDSFTQADGSFTRRFGGVGLGLAICRRLVARMGGELTVASEPGQGSVFAFTLRLELPEADVAASLLS
ncbi:MAG: PAS domain S-box protein [Acidobacteriota bacterium]